MLKTGIAALVLSMSAVSAHAVQTFDFTFNGALEYFKPPPTGVSLWTGTARLTLADGGGGTYTGDRFVSFTASGPASGYTNSTIGFSATGTQLTELGRPRPSATIENGALVSFFANLFSEPIYGSQVS